LFSFLFLKNGKHDIFLIISGFNLGVKDEKKGWDTESERAIHSAIHPYICEKAQIHYIYAHTCAHSQLTHFSSLNIQHIFQNTNSTLLHYLYLASVGRIPFGTGSMGPVSVSGIASGTSFGSGSAGRPA
jgi:hypothetical protein